MDYLEFYLPSPHKGRGLTDREFVVHSFGQQI